MNLDFNIYKLKEDSILFKDLEGENEFIVVGIDQLVEIDCYKAQQITNGKLILPGDLDIQEFSLIIPKNDLIKQEGTRVMFDIPKKYLTLDIIENIQKLNS